MSFFQNPFPDEFRGNWILGDRQYAPTFVLKGNLGRGKEIVYTWNQAPYNLIGNDADGNPRKYLNVNYCLFNFKNWGTIQIDLSTNVTTLSAALAAEVAASLNANALFAERFIARIGSYNDSSFRQISISQKRPVTEFQFYIANGQAEEALGFNKRAGVAELPTYFNRHTIANRFVYPDSEGKLVFLDPIASTVSANLINNAADYKGVSLGFSSGSVQADWQLLRGASGIFVFQKITVDGSNRITQILEYSAGARAGDLGKKTNNVYTGANTQPSDITQIPYTLTSGDLITPP